ncbi:metalloregulator ArsR/SmtB family transcription factor [Paenibacillus oenotherae]|uniref:Metalloregulator ArsR/SmtB family transcription factor n=1 Tax=Paenibacillus oenotherae TaxID=1435645 RepID=A0ABS7DBU3_9BACL|nr:metalloregulator ArsR/SmtB family transcription factor [Paenibacillus oenotherae]MBW7477330.1 metalloregulator ArsR/SmtB family transcription factor [Paenibacillus oenotherae]
MDKQKRLKKLADEFSECKKALTAIGDETRQSIIIALMESVSDCERGIRVGELTKRTNLSRPAVSHHLKILKDANLIGFSKEGTKNYYYLDVIKSDIFKLKKMFDNIEACITDIQKQPSEEDGV